MPGDRTQDERASYTTGGAKNPSTPGAPDAGTAARADASGSPPGTDAARAGAAPSLLPALTLPTGGGAIRGIGEKFLVNAATGTASLGIPLPVSPGRGGFGPQLELAYDSGSGNGPFGLGFNLSVPTITRKTDQGLPRYYDGEESDDYVLSGAEDLVPTRDAAGMLVEIDRGEYVARRYRPRVEGLFARIERWIHRATRDVHWRVTTRDNTTHVYGTTSASRIVDPKDEHRVFSWLLEESRDDKGNIVRYEYKPEDGVGVDPALLREKSRFEGDSFTATAQRYLKRALYCNAAPFAASDFLMELVFDYGEHLEQPAPDDAGSWAVRPDPFSSYRATFEVRTYRLCQRVLMFHRLSADRAPLLVKSTKLTYDANPSFTYLTGVTQRGHLFESGVWQMAELPTLELDYTRPILNDQLGVLSPESLEGLAGGVDGARKQWVDLDGEGIPGVLIDSDHAWYYKSNRGGGKLDPPRVLPTVPSPASLAGGAQQLEDLGGDGQLDLISYDPMLSGYFSRTPEGGFEPLRAFQALPNIDFGDPNLRFIDLDGDGHGDLLLTEEHAFVWHRSKAKGGFDLAERLVVPDDEDQGPAIVFADPEQSIQLADMSGDGLVDIVRVQNGQVSYWPNLGHGRFGKKITLENSPTFAGPEAFDARRVRFGDVDGSGTSDVFYLGADGISLFRNASGNRLGAAELIRSLPPVDGLSQLGIVDLLGQGTACLVWSSPLPSPTRPVLYVDLMGGVKPHLMRSVVNNLGAETRLTYAPSTKFYLADKAAGTPWLTRLAFPVQVLERIERVDAVSKSRLVSTYSYHHGYFDGVEREFRGFARVEQRDAEEFSTGSPETELDQPPTRTVTWFHTGAWLERERLEMKLAEEYFPPGPKDILDPSSLLLRDTPLPAGMTIQDEREATRALRGRMLRSEVYAEDGSAQADIPYGITEQNFHVQLLQSSTGARHGVLTAHARETLSVHTERSSTDPRVSHRLVLSFDSYGNIEREARISYPRATAEYAQQERAWATLTATDFINHDLSTASPAPDDWYRVGVQYRQRVFELTGNVFPTGQQLVDFESFRSAIEALEQNVGEDLDYEDLPDGITPQRRLLDAREHTFYRNDLTGPLPLGDLESLALPHAGYQLSLTPGLVAAISDQASVLTGTGLDSQILVDEGHYALRGGSYWLPSGFAKFDPAQFYLPTEAVDQFGQSSFVAYDLFSLLVTRAIDPLGNVIQAENDYRVLAPRRVTDPNLNRGEVRLDALGLVIATALMGKLGSSEGDTIDDPTTTIQHDLLRWQREQKPTFARTREREEHGAANTRFQESYTYSDGFGRVVMRKVQAEPGAAPLRDASGALQRQSGGDLVIGHVEQRWVGTGRTVFNNKGNAVKQYEPFFSSTFEYEEEADLVEWGVTPLLHYDPLDRLVLKENPDGTLTRIEFDAWRQRSLDASDAVVGSDWLTERQAPDASAADQRAAQLTLRHADTPTVTHFDALGRPFLTIVHNRVEQGGVFVDELYGTTTELDVEGNPLSTTDARGIVTLRQRFDALGRRYRTESTDSGVRLLLADVGDKPLRTWDSRHQTTRHVYDPLQRPTHTFVTPRGSPESLVARTAYGEALDPAGPSSDPMAPSPAQALNLRGEAYLVYDGAGVNRIDRNDFKGNQLEVTRRLALAYTSAPDWLPLSDLTTSPALEAAAEPLLEPSSTEAQTRFTTTTTYDALNRVTALTTPDGSVTRHEFNEANLLSRVRVSAKGGPETLVIQNIDYNARGQRILCAHGQQAADPLAPTFTITYDYDPRSFRLREMRTTRAGDGVKLQHLRYTYDASGNIVELQNLADHGPIFAAAPIDGTSQYTYDALYRLIEATGREHPSQISGGSSQPSHEEYTRGSVPHPNDLAALLRYTERFVYDPIGNIERIAHTTQTGGGATGPSWTQWTRRYRYEPTSNRLTGTSIPGDAEGTYSVSYAYDDVATNTAGAHGSMTSMPHLQNIEWDHADRMQHADLGGGGDVYFTYDSEGQRVRKVWLHNGLVDERIYLGEFEIYRRRRAGALELERETLHVFDERRRVAMVETKNVDTVDGGTGVSRWRFQLDNHLGSSSMEVDEAGAVISYEEYHPYGSTAFHTARGGAEVSTKRYRYTGKERDEETGLYYHGARYYAPWLGRWTSADPLGAADGPNLYQYVQGNPINASDPTGELTWWEEKLDAIVNPSNPVAKGLMDNLAKRGEALVNAPAAIVEKVQKEGVGGLVKATVEGAGALVKDTGEAFGDIAFEATHHQGDQSTEKIASRSLDVLLNVADAVGLVAGGVGVAKGTAKATAGAVTKLKAPTPKPMPVGKPPAPTPRPASAPKPVTPEAPAAPKPGPKPPATPEKPTSGPEVPDAASAAKAEQAAARRAELNTKYGRSGDLDTDINERGVVDSIRQNAQQARDITRTQRAGGSVGPSASAFGTRAHSVFERLNEALARRVEQLGFNIEAELFLASTGRNVPKHTAGSIGADVVVEGLTGGKRVFDLKTFVNQAKSIGAARQTEFRTRFGVRAEEIFVKQ